MNDILLRRAWTGSVGMGLLCVGIAVTGCQPPSETTREKGVIDSSGHALLRATAPSNNHHWSVDVALRDASEGTYALLFSTTEPATREWFAIASGAPALRCAAAHSKNCSITEQGDVVAIATVGPGGTGVLRATFDVGSGGWFRLMRVEGGPVAAAPFEVRIVSEALTKDEEASRFTIEQIRSPSG